MFVFSNYDFRRVSGCKISQLSFVYCKLLCFFRRHQKCFWFINQVKSKSFHYITELYKLMSQLEKNTFICKHLRTLPLSTMQDISSWLVQLLSAFMLTHTILKTRVVCIILGLIFFRGTFSTVESIRGSYCSVGH